MATQNEATEARLQDDAAPAAGEPAPRKHRWRRRLILALLLLVIGGGSGFTLIQFGNLPGFDGITARIASLPQLLGLESGIRETGVSEPMIVEQPVAPVVDSAMVLSRLERLEASVDNTMVMARLDHLEAAATDDQPDVLASVQPQLDSLQQAVATLATGLTAQGEAVGRLENSIAAALREARHARTQLDTTRADSQARAEMLEGDVKAVVSSLGNLRTQQSSLSGRLEALASDLHLMTRFGYGAQPQQPAGTRSTIIRAAPTQNVLKAPGLPAAGSGNPPPENLVQGRYRVGDWVGGWGTVTSIRKTPEGDHLITPAGVLFAPAAGPKAGE